MVMAYDVLERAVESGEAPGSASAGRRTPCADGDALLRPPQLFVTVAQDVCLAVTPGHMTVLGAMQQLDTRFTYDLQPGVV